MKKKMQLIRTATILLISSGLILGGCTNINPINPPSPYSALPPSGQSNTGQDYTVTYNYRDTGPVQLSANNIVLKVGQKLILQPAPGLTKNTRFVSSGENFWGNVMKQESDPQASGKAIFTAIKPGKGKLQIIPDTDKVDRAVDLWVTVQ